jgi:hypothetical protein
MESKMPKDEDKSGTELLAKQLFNLHQQADSINNPPSEEEVFEFYQAVGTKSEINTEQMKEAPQTIFVAFIKGSSEYEAHLVNPTSLAFSRIQALTWAIAGDSDGLMQTSKGVRELGRLEPYSSLQLEKDTLDGLDFVILYHLDLYAEYNNDLVLGKFNLPKGHWEYKAQMLPVLNREGMQIDVALRDDKETIEQEILHIDMESSYKSNDELLAP